MNMNQIIAERYDILGIQGATMTNPNGDPENLNLPRIDTESGRGIMTDVSMKAKIRRYVAEKMNEESGYRILYTDGQDLNYEIAKAVLKANDVAKMPKAKKGDGFVNGKVGESRAIMQKEFWDVRTFGAVMSTGLNAGQATGAAQVAMVMSYDPIETVDIQLTRNSFADGKFATAEEYIEKHSNMDASEKRTFGRKTFTPFALYPFKSSVSANEAQKSGMTYKDLDLYLEAIMQMHNFAPTASKMGMEMYYPLIIFKHVGTQPKENAEENAKEARLGCAKNQQLFRLLKVTKKPEVEFPRSIEDYEISFDFDSIPKGVEVGFKYGPFEEIRWGVPEGGKLVIC